MTAPLFTQESVLPENLGEAATLNQELIRGAISTAVVRSLHTGKVRGSIPLSPTSLAEVIRPGFPVLKQRPRYRDGSINTGVSFFVYVFKCGRFYKVGISNDPRRRLSDLQDCNPFLVEMVGYIRLHRAYAKALEGLIHIEIKEYWLRNEWFDVEPARLAQAIAAAKAAFKKIGLPAARAAVHLHSPVVNARKAIARMGHTP